MNVSYSKITTKSQTVIPRAVREELKLKPGDRLRYTITNEGILIQKTSALEDDPFSVFSEWASEADEKAYGNL